MGRRSKELVKRKDLSFQEGLRRARIGVTRRGLCMAIINITILECEVVLKEAIVTCLLDFV